MPVYHTDKLPDRIVRLQNGEQYLWFSGTDYLGLGQNEEFRTIIKKGLDLYGNHFGSSRNNTLQLSVYQECETALATFAGSDSALLTSSGMWAGQLVMKEIENVISAGNDAPPAFQYHYSPKTHPAIWGNNFKQSNMDWRNWAEETIKQINNCDGSIAHIICTDSVGSPWVEELDLNVFHRLPSNKRVWLIIDDSHGIGVTGDSGNGIFNQISTLASLNIIVVTSLNKALGIPAGVILANQNVVSQIRKSPWFSGASPTAPAFCYALKRFLETNSIEKAFHKLQANIRYFKSNIAGIDVFSQIENYPVFCSRNTALFQYLLYNGIMTSCFSYPKPTDPPIARIVISAIHQKEDLDRLAEVCIHFVNSKS